nr:eukaryotic aspartyl protease family protein [Tanacetum cinerariifolium]
QENAQKKKKIQFERMYLIRKHEVGGGERDLNSLLMEGVVGEDKMVIAWPESGVFFRNKYDQLCFQREREFSLASTTQMKTSSLYKERLSSG